MLALFDLDHTLLDGDSDVLWCEFLMDRGVLDRAEFEPRNLAMAADYQAGTVSVQEFCEFYVGTLAGRTPAQWQPVREAFMAECIAPRLLSAGRDCIERHRAAGDELLLTTATNRFITELTGQALGFPHLLATECGVDAASGRFTGAVTGTLNMREGKLVRLHEWLGARGRELAREASVFYSDSINDLPLLAAVSRPVAVDPDPRLEAHARAQGWPVRHWRATPAQSPP
jgi:HAD superfamily hydrolase (TIGR01490 family)